MRKPSHAKKFAEVENISFFGAVGRMGPIGLWMYARTYATAAASLPEPEAGYEPVRHYLTCHSIELSLKAFLSLHGATMLELSESGYGHNLESILASADAKSLSGTVNLTSEHRAEIVREALYYSGKVFEYPAVGEALRGYPDLPTLSVLLDVSNKLVASLEQSCKEAR